MYGLNLVTHPCLPTGKVYGRRPELCPDRASRRELVRKSLVLHSLRSRGSSEGETEKFREAIATSQKGRRKRSPQECMH